MARKNPPLKWPLPEVVHPPKSVCYQVRVPNERAYIGAFLGAMFLLSKPYAWQDDPAHTALEVGAVWREIFDNLLKGSCELPQLPNIGTDGNEDFMIRQNPDNPCILESSVNGTDWCQWADLSLCVPGPAQPGGGTPQPPPGECVTYHGNMAANTLFLVPTLVNTGDTLEITSASGATNDPSYVLDWRCPNGQSFVAGACVGGPATVMSDPLNTVGHMRLIYKIGASYYDAMAGVFTVPGGVTNAQVEVLVNDSTLTDNNGTLELDVKFCNNQSAAWTHSFDFAFDPHSDFFAIQGGQGEWAAGVGYIDSLIAIGINNYRGVVLRCLPAFHKTQIRIDFLYSAGSYGGNTTDSTFSLILSGVTLEDNILMPNIPPSPQISTVDSSISYFDTQVLCGFGVSSDPGGSCSIRTIAVWGLGPDPFV